MGIAPHEPTDITTESTQTHPATTYPVPPTPRDATQSAALPIAYLCLLSIFAALMIVPKALSAEQKAQKTTCAAGDEECFLALGIETERDIFDSKLALEYFEKSCSKKNLLGCAYLVGSLSKDGPLEAKDAPEMKKFVFSGMPMEQAALSLAEQCLFKEPIACTFVAYMSAFVKSEKAKVPAYYEKACSNGGYAACYSLGMSAKKLGDLPTIKSYLEPACTAGHLLSCQDLGIAYMEADQFPAAKETFTKACDKGDSISCAFEGKLLIEVDGTNEAGIALLEKACAMGKAQNDPAACSQLSFKALSVGNIALAKKTFLENHDDTAETEAFALEKDGVIVSGKASMEDLAELCDEGQPVACSYLGTLELLNGKDNAIALLYKTCALAQEYNACTVGAGLVINQAAAAKTLTDAEQTLLLEHACELHYPMACQQAEQVKNLASFGQACDKGDMDGCFACGVIYLVHKGDWNKAKPWFKKACDGGVKDGCRYYGWGLNNEEGKWKQAKIWYKKGCDQDDALSCLNHGVILNINEGKWKEAKEWFKKACDGGDMEGCSNYGVVMSTNEGNDEEAKKWFEKACEGGEPQGCYNLGATLEDEGKWKEAKGLYKKACDEGDMDGCTSYGVLLATHEANGAEANKWLEKACNGGDMEGCNYFGLALEYDAGKWEEAKPWYKKACDGGFMEGCNGYGLILETKEGNTKEAKKWLEKACSGGYEDACTHLK